MDCCWKNHAAVEIPVVPTTVDARAAAARAAAALCDEACAEAVAATLAAQEAAARCAAARDNRAAADLVKAGAGDLVRDRETAALDFQEAVVGHRDAGSKAAEAALEARKASVRCAAASRGAIAAASEAREAADRQVKAGGSANAADVFRAREAANLCVAVLGDAATEEDRAAAAMLAVPRADAAAAAARHAAASCDGALASPEADDDRKFLDSMRGWLMTVAALLANMTFTAIIKPPSWVPMYFGLNGLFHTRVTSAAPSLAPAPSPGAPSPSPAAAVDSIIPTLYFATNAITFVNAILLVIMLLQMGKDSAPKTLKSIRLLMKTLAVLVVCSFALATSSDLRVVGLVCGVLGVYAVFGLYMLFLY